MVINDKFNEVIKFYFIFDGDELF